MKSIIQSKKECFICRVNYDATTTNEIYEHHIFEEKQSEKYGLKIWLCHKHPISNPRYSIRYQNQLDLELKQLAQKKFEELHSQKEFTEHFIKSYV